ncbi:hypothetical protein V6N13_048352 [Hibiscus sabdariffa]|uniref:Uncharacterized protein n=1 Tax=Hibiscus sabdariffa TaxID=183260 RepID=A0ABR2F6Z3_9ROSI
MENPNSLSGNPTETTAGGLSLTSHVQDDNCPSEYVPCILFVQALERLGSPPTVEDLREEFCPKNQPKEEIKGSVNASSSSTNVVPAATKDPRELFGPWMILDNHHR